MDENEKSFNEILKEQADIKGFSAKKLSEDTGIPQRYIDNLLEGNFSDMPAAPYVRGYLAKIAALLEMSGEELWTSYKEEEDVKSSGSKDKLPTNRFAIKTANKKVLVLAAILIAVGVYLILNINNLLGQPRLEITHPQAETVIVNEPTVSLRGYIDPEDKLLINNQEILVGKDGFFEKEYTLENGLNTIEFSVARFLGKESRIIKQIIYHPQEEEKQQNGTQEIPR